MGLYSFIGITQPGEKYVIGYGIYPSESTLAYKELLDQSEYRNPEINFIVVIDRFKGL